MFSFLFLCEDFDKVLCHFKVFLRFFFLRISTILPKFLVSLCKWLVKVLLRLGTKNLNESISEYIWNYENVIVLSVFPWSLCRFCSRLSRLRLADWLRPTPSWLTCPSPTCWPHSSARCPSLCRTWAWTCPCPRAGVGSSCCCGCGGERWAAGWPLPWVSSIARPWGGITCPLDLWPSRGSDGGSGWFWVWCGAWTWPSPSPLWCSALTSTATQRWSWWWSAAPRAPCWAASGSFPPSSRARPSPRPHWPWMRFCLLFWWYSPTWPRYTLWQSTSERSRPAGTLEAPAASWTNMFPASAKLHMWSCPWCRCLWCAGLFRWRRWRITTTTAATMLKGCWLWLTSLPRSLSDSVPWWSPWGTAS